MPRSTRSLLRRSARDNGSGLRPRRSQRGGTMHRILTAVAGVIALLAVALAVTAAAPGAGQPRYLDQHASIKARVNDLLDRMTLEEKVGQMDQIVIGELRAPTEPANGECN